MKYGILLEQLRPSEEEMNQVASATQTIIEAVKAEAKKQEQDVVIVPGGSTAKGTNLAGNYDIDIFVRFKASELLDETLAAIIGVVAHNLDFSFERVHGSRDYFTFTFQNFFFELVPVKYVESSEYVENVTDMSALHVLWAKQHLTPKLQDDIRLAKQFCKAHNLYGAESYIHGVSGHVLDILVIHYGGFEQFIAAVAMWSGVVIIDPLQQHTNVMKSLNQSKLVSPLIVIDPIDKERNASAALSKDKYEALIDAAKKFQEQPTLDAFTITSLDITKLISDKQDTDELFICEAYPLEGKKDIVFTKILKVFEFIQRHLVLAEFTIRNADWQPQEKNALLYFYIDATPLKPTFVRQGPPSVQERDVLRFKKANPDAFEQNGFWWVTQDRTYIHAREYIEKLLNEEFILSRVEKISFEQK